MQKIFLSLVLAFTIMTPAFSQDAKALYETGRTFQRQGDYANAILVFNRALEQQPNDLEILKD
ncbi:MAG TPA: tetratricopeptide repeat protein, partial [Chitinophagaceae bacterium]|nr:tetratricopeptide repeat protein [Chitinophagaceae bacterium]